MINVYKFDLFSIDAQAIVIPVNTVGVMGAGVAKKFAELYPEALRAYHSIYLSGKLSTGRVFISVISSSTNPEFAMFFPTKKHWKDPSEMEWIDSGLISLRMRILSMGIRSIAMPAIGCGLGGLDFDKVLSLIEKRLSGMGGVSIHVGVPHNGRYATTQKN